VRGKGHFTIPTPISRKLYRIRLQKLTLLIRNQTSAFRWYECRWPWRYFKVIKLFHVKFLVNGALYGKSKSYYRVLIGNRTLAFDWCHFWWPWNTFEGHYSLGCHFHVHFSNRWQAFASRGLPAIAELLVISGRIPGSPNIRYITSVYIHTAESYLSPSFIGSSWCRGIVHVGNSASLLQLASSDMALTRVIISHIISSSRCHQTRPCVESLQQTVSY